MLKNMVPKAHQKPNGSKSVQTSQEIAPADRAQVPGRQAIVKLPALDHDLDTKAELATAKVANEAASKGAVAADVAATVVAEEAVVEAEEAAGQVKTLRQAHRLSKRTGHRRLQRMLQQPRLAISRDPLLADRLYVFIASNTRVPQFPFAYSSQHSKMHFYRYCCTIVS